MEQLEARGQPVAIRMILLAPRQPDQRSCGCLQALPERVLRLSLLAPDIVEAILFGRTDHVLMLARLERPLPASWEEQPGRVLSTFKR